MTASSQSAPQPTGHEDSCRTGSDHSRTVLSRLRARQAHARSSEVGRNLAIAQDAPLSGRARTVTGEIRLNLGPALAGAKLSWPAGSGRHMK